MNPKRKGNKPNMRKGGKPRKGRKGPTKNFDFSGSKGRPTLVLKAHALIAQNISGVNIKQINIAPTASIFGADVIAQFKYYQQYRIPRITVKFENLDPVNYQQGANSLELPICY